MKFSKSAIGVAASVAAAALLLSTTGAYAADDPIRYVMNVPGPDQAVFAGSYVTSGATSTINGDVLAGLYLTTGASADIDGSSVAVAATTLGASANVSGNVRSGTASTLGAGATVDGSHTYGTTSTLGASANVVGSETQNTTAPAVTTEQANVLFAQTYLSGLTPAIPELPGNIAADTSFAPGVYNVAGLKSVTAGVTITLDAAGNDDAEFIFNISNYLAFGAGVNVVVVNEAANAETKVIWNATGGYVTVGAGANIVGTVMAHGYVSTGANSILSGAGASCGAVLSATSYVSVGAGSTVGGNSNCLRGTPGTPH